MWGRRGPKQEPGRGSVLMTFPKAITASDRQRKFHIASEQDQKCAEGHLSLNEDNQNAKRETISKVKIKARS